MFYLAVEGDISAILFNPVALIIPTRRRSDFCGGHKTGTHQSAWDKQHLYADCCSKDEQSLKRPFL
jgi:hypothetical protein